MPLIRVLTTWLLRFSFVLLVLFALAISAVRLALPQADHYRALALQQIGQALGAEAQATHLALHLEGWNLVAELRDFALLEPHRSIPELQLKGLVLTINPLTSLLSSSPRVHSVTLDGVHLHVQRTADGTLEVEGLDDLSGGNGGSLTHFLDRGALRLVDSDLTYQDAAEAGTTWWLGNVDLLLDNTGTGHRAALRADLGVSRGTGRAPADPQARFRMVAQLHGPADRPQDWSGRVFSAVVGENLVDLIPARWLQGQSPGLGAGSLETWVDLHAGNPRSVLTRLALQDVSVPAAFLPDSAAPLELPSAEGLVKVERQGGGWRIRASDLTGEIGQAQVPVPALDFSLSLTAQGRPLQAAVSADSLHLGQIADVVRASPWAAALPAQAVVNGDWSGAVENLTAAAAWQEGSVVPARWRVRADLDEVGMVRAEPLQGLTGLTGSLNANQNGGWLALQSTQMGLEMNPLFSLPIGLTRLDGLLQWHHDAGGWHLDGNDVHLATPDLSGQTWFTLDLPADGSSPFLNLRAHFHDGDASHVRTYLPVGIMHPRLVSWLERAIRSGRVTQSDLVFHGALDDYPFRGHQGTFDLRLDFADASLAYVPKWPPLTQVAGSLHLRNQGLSVQLDSGRVYDTDVLGGTASIADLRDTHRMQIRAVAEGPFSDGLRTLRETPLADTLGPLPKILEVSGKSRLELDIDLPLKMGDPLVLNGHVSWPETASVGIRGTPVTLENLSGGLDFDTSSITAERIGGNLWGQPAQLAITTEGHGQAGHGSTVRVKARSQTPIKVLATRLPNPAWQTLSGDLDWNLAVILNRADLASATPGLHYELDSDLKGVGIDLPAPLAKSAQSSRPLALHGSLVPGQSLLVQGRLGDTGLNGEIDLAKSPARLARARLRLGADSAPSAQGQGVFIDGSLASLDLSPWIRWVKAQSSGSGSGQGANLRFSGLDLAVQRLSLGDTRLHKARLQVSARSQGLGVTVHSSELSGSLNLPAASDGVVDVSLDRVDLHTLFLPKAVGSGGKSPLSKSTDLPALDLRVADLRWQKAVLGTLNLQVRPVGDGISIPRFSLTGGTLVIHGGEGRWTQGANGGKSRVAFDARVGDLGQLFTALGYPGVIEQAPLKAGVALDWPGDFEHFSMPDTEGVIDLELGQGRLLDIEPGVGRVLGILNLGALNRRLKLDFSDLYGEGLAFTRMGGRIALGEGKAGVDDFEIVGPSSRLLINGLTDLRKRSFDQTVTLEPKIGSSVALASAVAGGPVVGAAVYLVDRVAGNAIDRLGRYEYRITGSWDDPVVQRNGWDPQIGTDHDHEPKAADDTVSARGESREQEPVNLFLDTE